MSIMMLVVILHGCAGGNWGWWVVSPFNEKGQGNLGFLADGFVLTVGVSLVAIFFSVLVGLIIAMPGLSSNPKVRMINRTYVEMVRSIPILVMILWVYYGLPELTAQIPGIPTLAPNPFWAGVIALGLSDSAFEAEIFRGGIQSVARGQVEAAQSLGLTYWQSMRHVILPQAIRRILPPLGNQLVYMLKMSSLISIIGLGELTRRANELNSTQYRALEIYTMLALEYLLLVLVASMGVRWLERRMANEAH